MGEKYSENSENWPLNDNCNNCEQDYRITPGNAVARHYSDQPECDFILCACPYCKNREMIFIGEKTLDDVDFCGIEIMDDQKYAPDEIFYKYLDAHGYEPPHNYALTDRHEALIQHMGEVLTTIPDDLLYDEITSPHDKPYQQRWV